MAAAQFNRRPLQAFAVGQNPAASHPEPRHAGCAAGRYRPGWWKTEHRGRRVSGKHVPPRIHHPDSRPWVNRPASKSNTGASTRSSPTEIRCGRRAPEQLVLCHHGVKRASLAWFGVPQFLALASLNISQPNGPGSLCRACGPTEAAVRPGDADKRDLPAIGRPHRLGILVHARVQVAQRFCPEIVQADETVIALEHSQTGTRVPSGDQRGELN